MQELMCYAVQGKCLITMVVAPLLQMQATVPHQPQSPVMTVMGLNSGMYLVTLASLSHRGHLYPEGLLVGDGILPRDDILC